jgi:Fe-S cluster assembly iron-binding protein IscA
MNTEVQNPAVVTLTENAANQIKAMVARQKEHEGKALRVYV